MNHVHSFNLIQRIALIFFITISAVIVAHSYGNTMTGMIPDTPHIDAASYILIDYNSGKVLAEFNADVRRNPASLTKMMTSYVVGNTIKSGKIAEEDIVTIGQDAWATGNSIFKGTSLMFLKPGDRVSVANLSRGINVQSGNDACVAMADYISGSQDAFINLMNAYAHNLGLQNTHFKTVHGLDAQGQYSSARDMVLIGRALIHDVPKEYAIYKEKEFAFNNISQMNRNGLLWDSSLHVDGIKTGHTDAAGYNLVVSAIEGQTRLIAAVLGGHTYKGCETESKKLLAWGFRFFETVTPLKIDQDFIFEPVWFGNIAYVALGVDRDVYLTIPRGREKDLQTKYILNISEIYAPLVKKQVVGSIEFQLDGKIIDQRKLVVMHDVKEGRFFSRIIDHMNLILYRFLGKK